MDLVNVHAADVLDQPRRLQPGAGVADVNALETVYKNNGFSEVKVTPETSTPETVAADHSAGHAAAAGSRAHAPRSRSPTTLSRARNCAWAPCGLKATTTSLQHARPL